MVFPPYFLKEKGHMEQSSMSKKSVRRDAVKSRGKPRVDDWRVLYGIIYIKKNELQWKDAPVVYVSHPGR